MGKIPEKDIFELLSASEIVSMVDSMESDEEIKSIACCINQAANSQSTSSTYLGTMSEESKKILKSKGYFVYPAGPITVGAGCKCWNIECKARD